MSSRKLGKKGGPRPAMKPKDKTELDLEDMLFGDVAGAGEASVASPVAKKRVAPIVDSDDEEIDYEAEEASEDEDDQVADSPRSRVKPQPRSCMTHDVLQDDEEDSSVRMPAWEDSDDEKVMVRVDAGRAKKLRKTGGSLQLMRSKERRALFLIHLISLQRRTSKSVGRSMRSVCVSFTPPRLEEQQIGQHCRTGKRLMVGMTVRRMMSKSQMGSTPC